MWIDLRVFLILLGTACPCFAVLLLRAYLLKRTAQVHLSIRAANGDEPLKPAETAYLARGGDITHTLSVLAIDVVQRECKKGQQGAEIDIQPYEQTIYPGICDFVKNYAPRKVTDLDRLRDMRTPMLWMLRLKVLRLLFGAQLQRFFRELIGDPLGLRKYFSFQPIANLTLGLANSGSSFAVSKTISDQLVARGMLVTTRDRRKCAILLAFLLPLPTVGIPASMFLLQGNVPNLDQLVLVILMASAAAATSFVILKAPEILPSWATYAWVASEIPRSSWRLRLAKLILVNAKFLARASSAGSVGVIAWCMATVAHLNINVMPEPLQFVQVLLLLSCIILISWYTTFQIAIDCYCLWNKALPSSLGRRQLQQAKERVMRSSATKTIGTALVAGEYDEQFSQMVALHGIETLWLLS
jgi:hypothetical protein